MDDMRPRRGGQCPQHTDLNGDDIVSGEWFISYQVLQMLRFNVQPLNSLNHRKIEDRGGGYGERERK